MTTAIDNAQAQGTFDVLSFIEGTAYPTEEVSLYTDVISADLLLKANNRRLKLDESPETEAKKKPKYKELDAEIAELDEKVKASALTFSLRGLPPGLTEEIYGNVNEDTSAEESREAEHKLVAATITGVRNAAGASDPRVWDSEAVGQLRRFAKEGEYARLVEGVIHVNFNATVFDQATDAGFLGGSSDVAE